MAGTAYPGFDPAVPQDFGLALFLPGTTAGRIMWNQWQNGLDSTAQAGGQPDPNLSTLVAGVLGAHTAGPVGAGSAAGGTGRPGFETDNTPGTFFEATHILPRTKIEFGNIITLVTNPYTVFSGFRRQSVTLSNLVNGATPGVTFPDITTPLVMPRLSSVVSSASTDNSAGTGLGTIVQATVHATQTGIPTFDAQVLFNFASPGNDPILLVSGSRVVLIPFEYENDVVERLSFATNVIATLDGREQRIATRKQPRQLFEVRYALEGIDRQNFQALMFDFSDGVLGLPLYHETVHLTAATSVAATSYPVVGALDVDFRVGGLAVIITDRNIFDVIAITAVTDTLISAGDPSVNAYPIGTKLMPLRTTTAATTMSVSRHINNREDIRVRYESTDNDTGALAGSTTPGFWSTFNSRVLFDDCNVVEGASAHELNRRLWRIDNRTGKVSVSSIWDRNKRKSLKGFVARSRADILTLRKLFIALRGRQKAFYLPTFISDLTLNANLVSGQVTMDVESIGYSRFAQDRLPFTLIHFTFADGTTLDRTIQSSVIVSTTVERLTVDTSWPANRTVAETERIEFYELVRFDTDELRLDYDRAGLARAQLPVLRVFDDNA